MTKRYDYNGGFISAGVSGQRGGMYSLARQFQLERTGNWDTDTNFGNVSILINAENASAPFYRDASANNYALSLVGDTRPNNVSPYDNVQYSTYFNGSTDFLTLPSNSVFNITTGTTPFTIEAWIKPMGNTGCVFSESFTGGSNPINIVISMADGVSMDTGTVGRTICFGWYTGGAWVTAAGAHMELTLGQWTHLACVFTGSTTRIYYNGVNVTKPNNPTPATTWGITNSNGDSYFIGRRWDATGSPFFNGFIKDFRFVRGTAVYTSNFTPPTAPLSTITNTSVLTCQNNRYIDNSGNNLTITANGSVQVSHHTPFTNFVSAFPGSVYFDGTGDYLTIASGMSVGTSDFTVEAWVYITSYTNVWQSIISTRASGSTAGATDVWALGVNNTGYAYIYSGAFQIQGAAGQVPLAAWTHISVTRAGSAMTLYINGNSVQTSTSSQNYTVALAAVGANRDGSEGFTGYINNLRLVVGPIVYTGNFVPPAQPLAAVTNTRLLTCQTTGTAHNSSFLDRSPYNLIVTRNGNVTQGSFNPYASGWSVLFEGGTDNLSIANNIAFGFGTGDYTVECWIYAVSNPANGPGTIVDFRTGATASATVIRINSSLQIMHYNGPANIETAFTTRTISMSTWTHIAVVRISGTVFAYINGVLAGSVASSSDFGNAQPVLIGQNRTAGFNFNGYISNFHVVKGTALYTSAFTPRLSPITAVANTSLLTCQNNRYLDNSSLGFTITSSTASVQRFSPFANLNQSYSTGLHSGSLFFDGTTDWLSCASTPATAFLANNFTIEFWVYFTNANATGSHQGLYTNYTTWAANSIYFGKHPGNGGCVAVHVNNFSTTTHLLTELTLPPNNAWTHYALVRNGTSVVLYRNGVATASNTVSATLSFTGASNPVFVGGVGDILSTSSLPGYMCDFRISNYAVYTAAFTPPTSPLTPDSGTQLLIANQAAISDQSMSWDFETNGDARISTAIRRNGSASLAFDGNNDWLFTPGNRVLNFGSGNWTVEAWVYLNAMPTSDAWPTNFSSHFVLTCVGTFNGGDGWNTIIGQTRLLIHSNDTQYAGTAHGMVINTWYHIAYVRNGNTIFFYVNGNPTGSVAFSGSLGVGTHTWIGCETGQGAFFNGFVDDLRVTRGVARYTAAFTPPARLAIR